jgi:type IV secretory pathway VirB2 component (pilin)
MKSNVEKAQTSIDTLWRGMLAVTLTMAATMLPQAALAGMVNDNNPIGTVLCNVVTWLTGPVGKGIATLAIIIIGLGALMGKVSWGMAIIVAIGVALIFGAAAIVNQLGGGGVAACPGNINEIDIGAS